MENSFKRKSCEKIKKKSCEMEKGDEMEKRYQVKRVRRR
jgi:hypothetical protein